MPRHLLSSALGLVLVILVPVIPVLVASVLLPVDAALAVPWFPSEPGPTFTYTGGTISVWGSGAAGDFGRGTCGPGWPHQCASEGFALDAAGDVRCRSVGSSSVAMPDPDVVSFEPPLVYLDFPLETGKTWFSQAAATRDWTDPLTVMLGGRVVGPAVVTVPAGTFEVIVVELTWIGPDNLGRPRVGTLWLHEQLGPINDLVSWTGVVDTGSISWGSLKATYR